MSNASPGSTEGSAVDPSDPSTQPWLWVPTFIAAHAFAAFWLARMYLLARPGLWRVVRSSLRSFNCIRQSGKHLAAANGSRAPACATQAQLRSPAAGDQRCTVRQEGPCILPAIIRRHSLLVQPLSLQWQDVGCTYETAAGPRVVLQGVNGRADSGTLHALMGPSGAGKSTLLDILAQRKQVGRLTGNVLLGGQPTTAKAMTQHSAYVPQEDNFMPVMSAQETLQFYAAMVLPPRLSKAARNARVEEVLAVVGLSHCTHTLVGGHLPGGLTLRGLSGGERKRLAIAVGLLAAPSLLFLDEPTSGLDSYAALTVLRYIRAMADEAGHVVVASIHQPRSAIWSMFDTVTVLSKGLMMYTGPRDGMVPWFTLQLPTVFTNLQQQQQQQQQDSLQQRQQGPSHVVVDVPTTHAAVHGDISEGHDKLASTTAVKLPQFSYNAELHGVASDWVMDLVSVGFGATIASQTVKGEHVGNSCISFRSAAELQAAATAFAHFQHSLQSAAAAITPANEQPVGAWHMQPDSQAPLTSMHTWHVPHALATVSLGPAAVKSAGSKPAQQLAGHIVRHNTLPPHRPWAMTTAQIGPWMPISHAGASGDEAEEQLRQRLEQLYSRLHGPQETAVQPQHPRVSEAGSSGTQDSAASSSHDAGTRPGSSSGSSHDAVMSPAALSTVSDGKAAAQLIKDFEAASEQVTRAQQGPTRQPASGCFSFKQASGMSSSGAAPIQLNQPSTVSLWLLCLSWMCCCCFGMPTGMLRWMSHLRALLWREVTCITRNPADVAGRLLTFAWIAVFSGLVFYSIPNTAESMQLRLNVHFANTAFFLLMPYISMSLYTADRQFYLADTSSRLYKPLTYYIAKVTATLPFNLLCAIVYCLIINGMTGLRPGGIVQASAITSMVSLIAVQVLHTAAIIAPNQDLAFMLAIAWTALNLLLSGFFIRYQQFAFSWLSQLRWLSAQGYAFEGLAGVELRGTVFNCSGGVDERTLQLLPSLLPDTPLAQSPMAQQMMLHPGPACVARADAVLDYFDLHRGSGATFAILLGYWAVMHGLTYAALVVASRAERR